MLRNLLLLLLLGGASATAPAQSIPAPPLMPPPATATTGELQGRPTGKIDPAQTVTLDTTPVKLRVDPRKPLPKQAPARPAPNPRSKPRQ